MSGAYAAALEQEHLTGAVTVAPNYTISDSFNPHQYGDAVPGSSDAVKAAGYHIWQNSGHTGFRPVIFKPNASFAALKAQRKLGPSPAEEAAEAAARGPVTELSARKTGVPGYTGYVRGMQHVHGRTFGDSTRRAYERDYRELACSSPIPSDPHKTRGIPLVQSQDTYVGSKMPSTQCHIPGYTGYVPQARDTFGTTFGAFSAAQLEAHNEGQQRSIRELEAGDRARPLFRRQMQQLDSAPLPGGIATHQPPQKLIPAHLRHVKYLAY